MEMNIFYVTCSFPIIITQKTSYFHNFSKDFLTPDSRYINKIKESESRDTIFLKFENGNSIHINIDEFNCYYYFNGIGIK